MQGLTQAEVTIIATLFQPPPRASIFNWILGTTLFLTILAFLLTASSQRALFMSSLFSAMGGSALGVGIALMLGLLRYPTLLLWLDIQTFDVIDILLPQIWPALAQVLGKTFIFTGCITIVPGLCGFAMASSRRVMRVSLPASSVILLVYAFNLLPESAFTRVTVLPPAEPIATPTAWPTFTPTPTPTPTPPPTPLPLLAGTALPQPGGTWWEAPDIVRCISLDRSPLEAIQYNGDALSIIQNGRYLRFTFAESDYISEKRLPRTFDLIEISPSGRYAALTEGRDFWLYALPDWTPVVWSRISTLRPITSILFTPDESLVIMGLQSGHLWVTDVQTGELVTLMPAFQSAVTALAPRSGDGALFAGAENGMVQIWDIQNRILVRTLSGHTESIQTIAPSSSEDVMIVLDAANRFIYWEASTSKMLRERGLAVDVTSNLLWFDDLDHGFVVGGTMDGQVFQLDSHFNYKRLLQFDSQITVLEAVGEDYLIVGTADGQYCVVGSPP